MLLTVAAEELLEPLLPTERKAVLHNRSTRGGGVELLLVGCSAPRGCAVGLGVEARRREVLKQECLHGQKKEVAALQNSRRHLRIVVEEFSFWSGSLEVVTERSEEPWGLCGETLLGVKRTFALWWFRTCCLIARVSRAWKHECKSTRVCA